MTDSPDADFLVVNERIKIPRAELSFSFARSSGPGGQNVNKVNSKAQLRWNVTTSPALPADVRQRFLEKFGSRLTRDGELVLSGDQYRDQPKNIADCLDRLREFLASVAQPPKRRKASRPTRGSRERRLKAKRQQGETKRGRQSRHWDG